MKTPSILALALYLLAAFAHAVPTVTNIVGVQRAGTKLVDVTYDVAAAGVTAVAISLEVSSDGGATFAVPSTTVTGAIGAGVAVGTGRVLTWNAGVDWGNQFSTMVRFRITADDSGALGSFGFIPAGTYVMGDAVDGGTTHAVTLNAFYLQKTETTVQEWGAVKAWGEANGYSFSTAGSGKATNHPVQTVSWYNVVKWCNAKSVKEGLEPCYYTNVALTSQYIYKTGDVDVTNTMVKWSANGYRLPTEAEWEIAARGGLSGKRFPWGDSITHLQANYYAQPSSYNYDTSTTTGYHPTYGVGSQPFTSPVATFTANGYGLYDMAGNVFEWCWDWYDGNYYASSPTGNPQGPTSGSYRVIRGGAWDYFAGDARCADRGNNGPALSSGNVGFRPARGVLQ